MSMMAARPRILTIDAPWKKKRLMRNASMMETTIRIRKMENVPIGYSPAKLRLKATSWWNKYPFAYRQPILDTG
jgi:hypothetical protein